MILILSQRLDETTSIVEHWLQHYSADYVRLNNLDARKIGFLYQLSNNENHAFIEVGSKSYPIEMFNAIWFRRFETTPNILFYKNAMPRFQEEVSSFIRSEKNAVLSMLMLVLSKKYWLNTPLQGRIHKIFQLQIAVKCNLTIPNTIITSNKQELLDFIERNGNVVIKPIQEITTLFASKNTTFITLTERLSKEKIEQIPNTFMVTLFQQEIQKEFEIRTFYLEGKFFSMAMFSQKANETTVDFRNYSRENPTRRIPYKLPSKIEAKLQEFMKTININCGSFDLIKSTEGEYVFLELNPVGQFGMTSFPCNYNIEKEIALHLIRKEDEFKN